MFYLKNHTHTCIILQTGLEQILWQINMLFFRQDKVYILEVEKNILEVEKFATYRSAPRIWHWYPSCSHMMHVPVRTRCCSPFHLTRTLVCYPHCRHSYCTSRCTRTGHVIHPASERTVRRSRIACPHKGPSHLGDKRNRRLMHSRRANWAGRTLLIPE